jgi:redox-sensitive bicupin YhaK (pirin superfamily)
MERKITHRVKGYATVDGAGVHLIRVLGNETVKAFDPFLMLDSFDSSNPDDYTAGFPMHPHRGIETITFLAHGSISHRDTMGFEDTITDGEVQYMNAGSGVLHEEQIPAVPREYGLQLWLNLPAKEKMSSPLYHAIKKNEIQEIPFDGGTLRLLMGSFKTWKGYESHHLPLDYYHIKIEAGKTLTIPTEKDRSCMAFTLQGSATIGGEEVGEKTAVKLSEGDSVTIRGGKEGAEVMFMSSKALGEPVYWGGPVVMDSKEGLYEAFSELRRGTFLKEKMEKE